MEVMTLDIAMKKELHELKVKFLQKAIQNSDARSPLDVIDIASGVTE